MSVDVGVLKGLITFDDEATAVIENVAAGLSNAEKKFKDLGSRLSGAGATLSAGITAPLVGAAAASLSFAADFDTTMTRVTSLAGLSKDEVASLKTEILKLAPTVGVGPQPLADALTVAASSGLNAADAMGAVTVAAKAQAAGMGDAKDVTRALSSVLNSYGSDTISAARAGNILTAAVKAGAAEAPEFASVLNKVVPVAASMGISFEEVAASIATYTRLGTPAAEAATGLRAAMMAIASPSEQAKKILAEVAQATGDSTFSFDSLRASVAENGLQSTLTSLTGKFKGNSEGLAKLLGSVEAYNAVMATSGVQAEAYADVLGQVTKSTGALVGAFKAMKGTTTQTWAEFSAQLQSVAIAVGDKLAPAAGKLLEAAQPVLEWVLGAVDSFSNLPGPVQTAALALGAVAAAIGPILLVAGSLISGIGSIIGLFAAGTTGATLLSGAIGAAGVAFTALTSPIVAIPVAIASVVTGIASLIFGWDNVKTALLGVKDAVVGFLVQIGVLDEKLPKVESPKGFRDMATDSEAAKVASAGLAIAFGEVDKTGVIAGVTMDSLTGKTKATAEQTEQAKQRAEEAKRAFDELTGQSIIDNAAKLAANVTSIGGASEITKGKVAEVNRVMSEGIDALIEDGKTAPKTWLDIAIATETALIAAQGYKTEIPKIGQAFKDSIPPPDYWRDIAAQIPTSISEGIPDGFATELGDQIVPKPAALNAPFTEWGQGLAGAIMGAVQGGGDIGGAIGSFVGKGLGEKVSGFVTELMPQTTGALGGLLTGAVGAVLPGVGALLGAGVTKIFDTVFKGEEKRVNDMRDQFVAQAGGIDALNASAVAAGVSLDKLLDAKKTKNFEAEVNNLKAAFEAHKQTLESWGTKLDSVMAQGTTMTRELVGETVKLFSQDPKGTTEKLYGFLNSNLTQVTSGFTAATAAAGANIESLSRLGSIAVGVFEQLQLGGMSVTEALTAMKPGFDNLASAAETLGVQSSGALGDLLRYTEVATAFEPALKVVSGLGDMMTGLNNTGLLTSSLFYDLAGQTAETFGGMVTGGADAKTALQLMQPDLQTIYQLQKDFGWEVDAATQSMIDQGVEAGIVGEKFQSPMDRMTSAVGALVNRLTDVLTAMGILPKEADKAASGIGAAIDTTRTDGFDRKIDALGGDLSSWLPGRADAGANAIGSELNSASWPTLNNKVDALGGDLSRYLPSSAIAGVEAINRAMNGIDVEGVQSAVHDIDWEFERGIPDAAASGVDIVNDHMNIAEGAIEDVAAAATSVTDIVSTDIPEAVYDARDAVADATGDMVDDFGEVEDAAARAAWGSSPTGIKEIPIAARLAQDSVMALGGTSAGVFGMIEGLAAESGQSVAAVWSQFASLSSSVLSMGRSGSGFGVGANAGGGSSPSPVSGSFAGSVWDTIVEAYKTGGLSNGAGGSRAILDPFTGRIIDPYDTGFGGGPHLTPQQWAASMGVNLPDSVFSGLMDRYGGPQHSGWQTGMGAVNADYAKAYLEDAYKRGGLSNGAGGAVAILDPFSGRIIDPYLTSFGAQTGFTPQQWAQSMNVTLPQSWYDDMMATYGGPTHNGWDPSMMPAGWDPAEWLSNLPGLATGGIVRSPSIARVAENGPEAWVPLDKWERMTRQQGDQTIVVKIGDEEFGRFATTRSAQYLRAHIGR